MPPPDPPALPAAAIVVLMSAQGQSAPDISHLLDCSAEYVRRVIHDFNDIRFEALNPK
jgi:hypothetical protein